MAKLGSIRGVQTIAPQLGRVIRKYRLAAGFSQDELAKRSDLHWTHVSQVERGRRNVSVDALRHLAQALDATAWRLLQEAEAEPETSR